MAATITRKKRPRPRTPEKEEPSLKVKVDLLDRKINVLHSLLKDIKSRLPPPSTLTSDWWQTTPSTHPLFRVIDQTLQHIKTTITYPQQLQDILYNPCRSSIPTTKKKQQTTAHSPLIPYLLQQAGFPILLNGYTP